MMLSAWALSAARAAVWMTIKAWLSCSSASAQLYKFVPQLRQKTFDLHPLFLQRMYPRDMKPKESGHKQSFSSPLIETNTGGRSTIFSEPALQLSNDKTRGHKLQHENHRYPHHKFCLLGFMTYDPHGDVHGC